MTAWSRSHLSNLYGPVPVGCSVAYTENRVSSTVPAVLSASYSFMAVGLCIEKDGSVIACTNAANGLFSLIVASVGLVASQLS